MKLFVSLKSNYLSEDKKKFLYIWKVVRGNMYGLENTVIAYLVLFC